MFFMFLPIFIMPIFFSIQQINRMPLSGKVDQEIDLDDD